MENKMWAAVALVAGFVIGKNWNKIKEGIHPYTEGATQKLTKVTEQAKTFLKTQKDKIAGAAKTKKTTMGKAKAKASAV